ncbi:hypothetical protein EDB81DRAFT_850458 [Dactylonectria macrodidyma]|uniref:Uncharacterized protein n=1 Tax=Dactylonectria macrodidyma TaxID=307937 RepID=A0A9P9FV82_9HYPO|nr:hypothetical protein EDB81DRAFT_850458 [Dactylonectria macrodidyma]
MLLCLLRVIIYKFLKPKSLWNLTDMAPSTRAAGRQARDICQILDQVGDSQNQRLWTPEPDSDGDGSYKAWGRKHYGDDWYEQRETMLEERNFWKLGLDKHGDRIYMDRQKALREMEHKREDGNLPMTKGWTWEEVRSWARMHYGEVWLAEREALMQANYEMGDVVSPGELGKRIRKANKRCQRLRDVQRARDEEMLAAGKTWHEILSKPVKPLASVRPSVETQPTVEIRPTDGYEEEMSPPYSPSTCSELSMGSGFSTYPPTPTSALVRARDGPLSNLEHNDLYWERAAWVAMDHDRSETQYEEMKIEMLDHKRSWREDNECELKREQEWLAIVALKWDHPSRYYEQKDLLCQRARAKDLRQKGHTQEQIDAILSDRRGMGPPSFHPSFHKAVSQEDFAAISFAWDAVGISKERQAELVDEFKLMSVPEPEQPALATVPEKFVLTPVAGIDDVSLIPEAYRLAPLPEEWPSTVQDASPPLGPRRSQRIAAKVPEAARLSLGTGTHPATARPDAGSKRRPKGVGVVKGAKPTGVSKTTKGGAVRAKRRTRRSRA